MLATHANLLYELQVKGNLRYVEIFTIIKVVEFVRFIDIVKTYRICRVIVLAWRAFLGA